MGKLHNKAELADRFKSGHTGKALDRRGWYTFKPDFSNVVPKDPLEFANSNQLSKMKRKKK